MSFEYDPDGVLVALSRRCEGENFCSRTPLWSDNSAKFAWEGPRGSWEMSLRKVNVQRARVCKYSMNATGNAISQTNPEVMSSNGSEHPG